MQPFIPQTILIESQVRDSALAQRVLARFPNTPCVEIENFNSYKNPAPITAAKKMLALVRHRGRVLKPFPKVSGALNLGDFVFNPISNCHLECTYCILQSYLANNPVLTVYANLDEMLQDIEIVLKEAPEKTHRVGTGELSDSLALDWLTGNSSQLIPFFAARSNSFLELKTKSNCIENLLKLPHRGRTVISWSMSPQYVVTREELKCASLLERIEAARRVQAAGYPVGIHLDPMIYFSDWERHYDQLIETLVQALDAKTIAWVSLGTLRFDKDLKKRAGERFPNTTIFTEDFVDGADGKMRYFKTIRMRMYRSIWRNLADAWPEVPRYLSMEAPWVWQQLTHSSAPDPVQLEQGLIARLEQLRQSHLG